MKTILIAGGTGFLGQVLEHYFTQQGHTVLLLTRRPKKPHHIQWDARTLGSWTTALALSDVLINLTGKSVNCRYTQKNKDRIMQSRVASTSILGEAIALCKTPPEIWINSSTATIYDHSLVHPNTETSTRIGHDFSMTVAQNWERTFFNYSLPKTRQVALRTSIVMGKTGDALVMLKRLTQLGLGGTQGKGDQLISWIHEYDFANAVHYIINNESISGVINVTAPNPIKNRDFMMLLRKLLKIPFGLPQPQWLLELGSFFMRTETELLLKSRYVIPEKLQKMGYKFQYPHIKQALTQLLEIKKT